MITFHTHLINKSCSIKHALERLDILAENAILFIIDDEERLIGSLTDGDVRRALIKGFSIDDCVFNIIYPNPKFIRKTEYDINKLIEYRENEYKAIPVLDKLDKVINVINFRQIKSYLPIDVVIMAGGRGERLKPLTNKTPKPLLKVGDKPIVEHNIDRLRLFGINEYWITLRYLGEQVEAFLGNGNNKKINIRYLYEDEPLGTIGAVAQIKNFIHDFVMVTNSDLLTNIDYEHFFLDFLNHDADFSVVTIPYTVDIPYAVLETNNGQVINFKEKPTYTYYSNGGIYLMKREVLNKIPIAKHFNATDLIQNLIQDNKKVISYKLTGYWLDIGRHEDFEKAQNDIKQINFK